MIRKQILFAAVLLFSIMAFGQKAELKAAAKAIAKSNFTEALVALDKVEKLKGNLDDKSKAKFYFLKAKTLNGTGNSIKAVNAVKELLAFEKSIGSAKYTKEAEPMLNSLLQGMSDKGIKAYQNKNYSLAKTALAQVYNLRSTDTTFLEYAANAAYLDKDYDMALTHFTKLRDLGYTGIGTNYTAVNAETGERENLPSQVQMDLMVKTGQYKDPKVEVTKSKKASVIKNIAFIYVEKGDNEKAIEAIQTAREADPNDVNMIITEANIQIKLGNREKFGSLMEEAVKLTPNDASLYYNIGVINQESKKYEEARAAYKKAIELKPDYGDAYTNLGYAELAEDEKLVEEMNANLNNFDKYDAIKARQLDLYKSVLPTFEKASSIKPKDKGIMRTLMSIYENLEMYDKLKSTKAIYDGLGE